ncbi:hypothetical protein [Synechococcus sp. WH 8016]|uniref:hypothetical protein n=1 Tax=Synechococcus sp. WH 8016 TaxID=166318 RepID=UPI00131F460C|nr:hypothetical protein [Synechococcus sp. WH 8016]
MSITTSQLQARFDSIQNQIDTAVINATTKSELETLGSKILWNSPMEMPLEHYLIDMLDRSVITIDDAETKFRTLHS